MISSARVMVRVSTLTGTDGCCGSCESSIIPRRSPSLRRAPNRFIFLDKSPRGFDTAFQIFGRHVAIHRRQKTRIGTLLDCNEVHILELARVSVRTDFLEYAGKDLSQR